MNVKDVLKKNKVAVASIAVLLVLGVTFGGIGYAENKKAMEKARVEQVKADKKAQQNKKRWADLKVVCDKLFGEVLNNETIKTASIKDDLKSDTVKEMKKKYYKSKVSHDLEGFTNEAIVSAENQLKQIDTAQKAVEQVYKDKVLNTDQKKYDTAKKEVDKIKNAKAKKELSDKLAKVKSDIDKKNKEKEDKKKEAEKASKEAEVNEVSETVAKTNDATEQQVVDATGQQTDQAQQQTPQAGAGQETGYYEPQAPVTDNGAGTNQNVAPTAPVNNGNTGGTQTPAPPAPEPTPEPTQPAGPPAGWITPPFPVGSNELWIWLDENGYSGFDHSDGYIRPY
ncbi:hypothetical protein GIX45_17035 [Erwinia sp. CPCC 100877]|nr:hypothetical protein [Erwinia sp. CPCC 100877]